MPQLIIPAIATATGALVARNQAAKQKSAAKTAENIMQGREGQQLSLVGQESEAVKEAARGARQNMLQAGAATPEETERVSRYKTKATTPAETLMTESGPIAQAVARRVQERVDQPGLDYTTNQAAFTEGITNPLWRALKARGIVPPPGAEGGGGLATQQYMKGAEPALAELRARQISEDITRGQAYGTEGRGLQQVYQELENTLAEAIRDRLYRAGITGAASEQAGLTEGSQLAVGGSQQARSQSGLNELYSRRETEAQANKNAYDSVLTSMLDSILSGLGGVTGTPTAKAPTTVPTTTPKTIPTTTKTTETPYTKQLQQITLANALRNARTSM